MSSGSTVFIYFLIKIKNDFKNPSHIFLYIGWAWEKKEWILNTFKINYSLCGQINRKRRQLCSCSNPDWIVAQWKNHTNNLESDKSKTESDWNGTNQKKTSYSKSAWQVIAVVDETVLVGWSETHGEVRGGVKNPTSPKTQGTSRKHLKTTRSRQRVTRSVYTIEQWEHRWEQSGPGQTTGDTGERHKRQENQDGKKKHEEKTRKKENHREWQNLAGSCSKLRPGWNRIQ